MHAHQNGHAQNPTDRQAAERDGQPAQLAAEVVQFALDRCWWAQRGCQCPLQPADLCMRASGDNDGGSCAAGDDGAAENHVALVSQGDGVEAPHLVEHAVARLVQHRDALR